MIVQAKLIGTKIDGIELMLPSALGKVYLVELDSKSEVDWINFEKKYTRKIEAVWDIVNGGMLPFELLELKVN